MNQPKTGQRGILRVWNVEPQNQGDGHTVGMVLPPGNWEAFDPFLLMAEDWFQQGTFPFHPHRGMETVTFVIDGKLKHEDNHGGNGVLEAGDVQWMTAGKGIVHSEDPLPEETVHSLQLWVNLPRTRKMTEPRYQDLRSADAPVRQEDGALIRVFSGSSFDVEADTLNHVPVTYVELELKAGSSVRQDLPANYNGFLYVLDGSGRFGKDETYGEQNQVLWLDGSDGDQEAESEIQVHAEEPLRAILVAGEPIGEPVVAGGPFVTNSEEEISQAYQDFRAGKFKK
ncbi:MAG TPA: pirin family protein [Bacillales bacterium]|nr:pirin family protein [Bacillales bacterium]